MFTLVFASNLVACLILAFVMYVILRPMLSGAVYFPTKPEALESMLRLADIKPGEKVADLGSGDGRIVIAFAKAGIEAHGYEVNPFLVLRSRRAIREAGVQDKAVIHWKSFWRTNLAPYNIVVVYMFPHIIKKLEMKLRRNLRPGTKVISNVFHFPDLAEARSENKVRLYEMPD